MGEIDKLSHEQQSVATCEQSTKVQAFAGTGKSTSLIGYVKEHPKESILYLCFNKPNRVQFQGRVKAMNLSNINVSTAHSVAKRFIYGNGAVKLTGALAPGMIVKLLHDQLEEFEPSLHLYLAHHANKMLKSFCSTKVRKIQDFNYLDQVSEDQSSFVQEYYEEIQNMVISVMKQMTEQKIPVLHDYYLKLFQVQGHKLPYDTILFDEVQDCSPVMIDMVQTQKSKNIYVGDTHQEIYAWRGAVNAFNQLSMHSLFLSESFRFGPNIARIAMHILNWKKDLLNEQLTSKIIGAGPNPNVKGRAFISRTTVGLLHEAIVVVFENPTCKIRFQGGLLSYLTHEFGFTLLDVFTLYCGKPLSPHSRTTFLREMSFLDLSDYASVTEDHQITAFVKLCEEYSQNLPSIIKGLEQAEVRIENQPADLTMSTAHRLKGIEFQEVTIADDFYTREALFKRQMRGMTSTQVREEVNLLYVSVSRASKELFLNPLYLS